MVTLIQADARRIPLADKSVHCCVTSPPYWGLRDYGVAGQLGLEQTPEEYIAAMVEVFREVKRVLRDDGTLWLNIGDSYAAHPGQRIQNGERNDVAGWKQATNVGSCTIGSRDVPGLKPKDLVGVPWMLAFALRADGWYLRSDIIWSKPNPMPESVTDRPTKAHEYIFLLTKNARYFYNAMACREPVTGTAHRRGDGVNPKAAATTNGRKNDAWNRQNKQDETGNRRYNRNKRTVWEVCTQAFPEAHFATFPEELIKPCILAGTSIKCCAKCGVSWEPIVEASGGTIGRSWHDHNNDGTRGQRIADPAGKGGNMQDAVHGRNGHEPYSVKLVGYERGCDCGPDTQPCTVLDPFSGSGTTCLVARDLQCNAIGLELNPSYIEIAKRRLAQEVLSFA